MSRSKKDLELDKKYWKERAEFYQQEYEVEANKAIFAANILNRIRATLMSNYQWDGQFVEREKDLADVINRVCRTRSEACANVENPE